MLMVIEVACGSATDGRKCWSHFKGTRGETKKCPSRVEIVAKRALAQQSLDDLLPTA